MTTTKPRLSTRIAARLDRRLRTTAAVTGLHITVVLETALDKGLPTADQLAELIRTGGAASDESA